MNVEIVTYGLLHTKTRVSHQLLTVVNGSHLFTAPDGVFQPNNIIRQSICPSELSRS